MADSAAQSERRVASVDITALELGGGRRVHLEALGFASLINLRGSPDDDAFLAGAQRALGVALPLTPNRCNEGGGRIAAWLGPDEWLIMAADGEARSIEAALREAVTGDPWLSVVDVSNNYTGFMLCGSAAREVLAKGCPLDLHPAAFASGDCAQTVVAGARVLLRVTGGPDAIEIRVRNSFARYTAAWLADAMAEYRE